MGISINQLFSVLKELDVVPADFTPSLHYQHAGKFEGCHISTIYFYQAMLDGDGEIITTHGFTVTRFDLTDDEKVLFGFPPFLTHFDLCISEDGSVHGAGIPNPVTYGPTRIICKNGLVSSGE